jgi:hypothetical protein
VACDGLDHVGRVHAGLEPRVEAERHHPPQPVAVTCQQQIAGGRVALGDAAQELIGVGAVDVGHGQRLLEEILPPPPESNRAGKDFQGSVQCRRQFYRRRGRAACKKSKTARPPRRSATCGAQTPDDNRAPGPADKDTEVSPRAANCAPRAAVNTDSALVWHHGGPVSCTHETER